MPQGGFDQSVKISLAIPDAFSEFYERQPEPTETAAGSRLFKRVSPARKAIRCFLGCQKCIHGYIPVKFGEFVEFTGLYHEW
jgi:hypothetical protein